MTSQTSDRTLTISRREVMGGVLGASALAAGLKVGTGKAAAADRPNIIFILADDLGVADLSCYGAPQIKTPAVDRIAREGARFTQAYANSAVCTASRVALITGRYQYRLPVGLEEPLGFTKQIGLPPTQPTLPSILKKAGYSTWLIGKWHLGDLPDYGPQQSGYDHFYGLRGGGVDYFSHQIMGNPDLWNDDTPIKEPGYLTDLLGNRAVQTIKAQAKQTAPYFMSVHFTAPHWPWEGPGDEAESQRIGANTMAQDGGKLAVYNAMVEAMDRQIGLMLKALDDSGQARNTIVVFTSDNGGERFSNTWPFSGKKSELLEGGIRIPSVIRWPQRIPAGVETDQVSMLMDWLPTLVAAAETTPDPSAPSDGINLLAVLTGHSASTQRTVYWRYKANAQRAIRDGDFKALKIGANTYLFNVVDDPLERQNLKKRHPEIYKRLTQQWMTWNATMLPEHAESFTYGNSGDDWADHINTPKIDTKRIDDGGAWPD